MNRKFLVVAGIVVILFIIGFLLYKFSFVRDGQNPKPLSNETDDWATYINNEYGYSIKYPKGWRTQDEQEEDRGGISFARELFPDEVTTEEDFGKLGYQINTMAGADDTLNTLSIVEWVKKANWIRSRSEYKEENVIVDNNSAVKVCAFREDFPGCSIFIAKDANIYVLELIYYNGSISTEADKVFGQMVSTFAFLE